ncbi:hypothetical protein Lal_00047405 [Lupinus albus]|nr:hypothetical protein Lal_00047405 [Lupinus albus]
MKRQRGGNVNPPKVEDVAANAMRKKKTKKEVEQEVVKVEERIESTREVEQGGWDNVMGWNWEEYMPWLGGVVDEQMSWGSTWFPWWDMDFNEYVALAKEYEDLSNPEIAHVADNMAFFRV